MAEAHVLLVALATHGHFNPGLHLAAILSNYSGVHVTFATSAAVRRHNNLPSTSPRLSFAFFSDGHDDGFRPGNDVVPFLAQFEREASKAIKKIILKSKSNGNRPFTFVIYSLLTPWMANLARFFHLPSALFWNQSAIVFAIYHHFFNGYKHVIQSAFSDPETQTTINLPGLPLLNSKQIPSLCNPTNSNSFVLDLFKSHFDIITQEQPHFKILVNSFDELEHDIFKSLDLIPIGPVMLPWSNSIGGDVSAWLNSKAKGSVAYVSFGSIAAVSEAQLEEIARGLLDSRWDFLCVMTRKMAGDGLWREELEARGKIVSWCSSQMEVLSNPAIGCFLTHCGWNSTLESIVCGVPIVAFPQWTDQGTNAKVIEEFSETGVRLRVDQDDDDEGVAVVGRREIRRCLDIVMGDGEEGETLRRNALKWKALANKAAMSGGSSNINIRAFVDEVLLDSSSNGKV